MISILAINAKYVLCTAEKTERELWDTPPLTDKANCLQSQVYSRSYPRELGWRLSESAQAGGLPHI
jgi:hypothetical protein